MCIDGITDYEELIEAIISRKKPDNGNFVPSMRYAVGEAMKQNNGKSVAVISDAEVPEDILRDYGISGCRLARSFTQMFTEAAELKASGHADNILLLGCGDNGYAAALFSGKNERCMDRACFSSTYTKI